jgi:pimeloyl-ACP methyl ester carboxylesterase
MEAFLVARSVNIRYRTEGHGKPVLLLHGWGANLDSFRQVFADLATSYQVTAIDFPGHGQSGLPPESWDVSDFTACLLDLMDQLHLDRPSIIAHSFGGRVSIKLAAGWPQRLNRLILVDAAGVPSPRSLKFKLKVAFAKIAKAIAPYLGPIGAALKARVYAAVQSRDYAAAGSLRETFVKVIREDLTPYLPKIQAPTLLIWGENDHDTPVSSAETMKRLIPNSELVVLKDAGHFAYIDQFSLFRLRVRKFLFTAASPEAAA